MAICTEKNIDASNIAYFTNRIQERLILLNKELLGYHLYPLAKTERQMEYIQLKPPVCRICDLDCCNIVCIAPRISVIPNILLLSFTTGFYSHVFICGGFVVAYLLSCSDMV